MKATAVAHSNLALIKYWGKKDIELNLPMNSSISMSLNNLTTTTTVEFSEDFKRDVFILDGNKIDDHKEDRVVKFLDTVRKREKVDLFAKVYSENNFLLSVGLGSSASGFAALATAVDSALELNLSEKELSILARLGSGSASRSISGGFVEWKKGKSSENSYAVQIAPKEHFDVRDIIVIVNSDKKPSSSTEGHNRAFSSPLYEFRLEGLKKYYEKLKNAILNKDFKTLGRFSELDTISMHTITMTSDPPIYYWLPETVGVMLKVQEWRNEGLEIFFSMDAGHNLHLLTLPDYVNEVEKRLSKMDCVIKTIHNKIGDGSKVIKTHLF